MPDDAPVQPVLQPTGRPPDALDHAPPGTRWHDWRRLIPAWSGAALALVILVTITAYEQDTFLKLSNILNILKQSATVGIVAVGMTLVITMGGIDLSVGSLLALAGGLGILAMNHVSQKPVGGAVEPLQPVLVGAAVTIGVGLVVGLFNGLLVTKGKLAPFIATLAGLLMFRSIAGWIANGGQFFSAGSTWFEELGEGFDIPGTNTSRTPRRVVPAQLPYLVVVWLVVACFAALLLNRTRLGRYIVAIGNNERAARYSAIAVDRVKIIAYTLLGAITGVAALMNAANYTSVNSANTGIFVELDAIAAVVIGGTRLEGGSGSVFGTIVGVLLLGVIRNFMVMLNVNSQAQGLVIGAIIIAAGLLQRAGRRA
jgi:ribose transport system permease protein